MTPLCICTNAFPAKNLDDRIKQFDTLFVELKKALDIPQHELCPLGIWFDSNTIKRLVAENQLAEFARSIQSKGFSAYTANAFPYGTFHQTAVKTAVYTPDWATQERLDYSVNVAKLIAHLLPENGTGSLSTLPAGYHGMSQDRLEQTAKNLKACADQLAIIKQETGKHVNLAIEMEPDCQWESPRQFAQFYLKYLADSKNVRSHVGVCYDTCHQELLGGKPGEGLQFLLENNIPVPKIQFSAALAVTSPDGWKTLLDQYQDSVYLHQTRFFDSNRTILSQEADMPKQLPVLPPQTQKAVVHYHVPVNFNTLAPGLETAKDELIATLDYLKTHRDFTPDLEIETYTYSVLPGFQNNPEAVLQAMKGEYDFINNQLP